MKPISPRIAARICAGCGLLVALVAVPVSDRGLDEALVSNGVERIAVVDVDLLTQRQGLHEEAIELASSGGAATLRSVASATQVDPLPGTLPAPVVAIGPVQAGAATDLRFTTDGVDPWPDVSRPASLAPFVAGDEGGALGKQSLIPWVCFAPGTSPDLIAEITGSPHGHLAVGGAAGSGEVRASAFQFFNPARWSSTAITQAPRNGPNALRQGDPITITWSIIPDGTAIAASGSIAAESSDPSNLIAFLNGIYGNQATWLALMQEVFDRWSELGGVRYVYEPNDDGAGFPGSGGALGLRGDVRIGGHSIDGGFNTLAYNYSPSNGDMVIDTADSYFNSTSSNSRRLRNVIAHEHGHGLGLQHVCPMDSTKLMEPNATSVFDGPQHDDIFSVQRQYGDRYEDTDGDASSDDNDTFTNRTNLGTFVPGLTTLTPLSIDDNSDQDYLSFNTSVSGGELSVVLRPLGLSYLEGGQNSDGSCSGGTMFNSKAVHNLGFALLDPGGSTLITRDANAAGVDEVISALQLPPGAGPFTIHVFGDATNNAQLYELEVALTDPNAPPDIAIADSGAIESAGAISFVVQLSKQSQSATSIDYTIEPVTATSDDDFTPGYGTVTIPAGDTSQTLDVSIADDSLDELDETLRVVFSNPTNGVLVDVEAIGTITDDDLPPLVSVGDVWLTETGGAVDIPVTLSAPSGLAIRIAVATASGSAAAGADFDGSALTLRFLPGEVSKSVSVNLIDDGEAEVDETFSVQLSNPSNVEISAGSATVTILDDDALALLAETGTLSGDAATGEISIAWAAVPGRSYTLLFSVDLVDWSPLPGAELITATASEETFIHGLTSGTAGFYRVVEGWPPD